MSLSSLQRRVHQTAIPVDEGKVNDGQSSTPSFESCFSAGLDLTEFTTNGLTPLDQLHPSQGSSVIISAAAELAKIKAQSAARVRKEEEEEATLERRVAEVAATKSSHGSSLVDDFAAPKALHPHANVKRSGVVGEERDNNFIRLENSRAMSGQDFLSSLVYAHESERQELKNNRHMSARNKHSVNLKSRKANNSILKRQHKSTPNSFSSKKVVKKKSAKSKF